MADCKGECTIQEFEVRQKNPRDAKATPVGDCPPLTEGELDVIVTGVHHELERPAVEGCCEGPCRCSRFPGQNPPWTDRTELTYTRVVGKKVGPAAECMYTIEGTVEIRSRIFKGLCVPRRDNK